MAEETMKDFEKEIEESLKNRKKYEDPDAGKWDLFAKMKDEKQVVEVKITEVVNGGCVTELEGERAFIPASQLSTNYVEDLNSYLNKRLEVIVITADEEKNRLVLSHREIERAKEQEKKAEAKAVGEITNEEPTERFDYKESGEAATNLGALLKGLKL